MPVKQGRTVPLYLMNSPSLAPVAASYEQLRLVTVGGWGALFERMREVGPDSVVLVDPYDGETAEPCDKLFGLLESFPSVAVVVALRLTPARVGDVRWMIEAGAAGVLDLAIDTSAAVAVRHFHDAVGRPFKRRVQAVLPAHLSADARVMIRAACEVAVLGGGARELADAFDVTPKTFAAWCESRRLPTTRALQLWLRLLLAALLLEDAGRTVQSAARAAGYSGDRALRRAFDQLLGSGPGSLRCGGAFEAVARAFADELRAIDISRRAA